MCDGFRSLSYVHFLAFLAYDGIYHVSASTGESLSKLEGLSGNR